MVEKKCFPMFCQNCQFFGCTPRLKSYNFQKMHEIQNFGKLYPETCFYVLNWPFWVSNFSRLCESVLIISLKCYHENILGTPLATKLHLYEKFYIFLAIRACDITPTE